MGFRFRKSIKAGPFRINFSKSGIGYSVGGKGFRYTKKANGGTMTTASIPGTGLSYVKDHGRKAANSSKGTKRSHIDKSQKYASAPAITISRGWINALVILLLILFYPIGIIGMWAQASWKVKTKVTITIIFAILTLLLVLCIQPSSTNTSNNNSTIGTEADIAPTPTDATIQPVMQNKYAIIDKFIELFDSSSSSPINNISKMDIHGTDYRTEFRLNAFSNAVGKKGDIPGGTIEIVNYGTLENDEFRIYAFTDTFGATMDLYTTIVRTVDASVSEADITNWYHQYEGASNVKFNLSTAISCNINSTYANGGFAGYDLMFGIPVSAFWE